MRLTTSFALCAIFAAYFAFSPGRAAAQREVRSYTGGRFSLDISGNRGLIGSVEGDAAPQQRIKIEGWSWGTEQAESGIGPDIAPGAAAAIASGPGGAVLGRGAPIDPVIPVPKVVAPRDVASGQASGKRQHSPVTITKEWGARAALPLLRPLPSGSVRVTLGSPWLACRIGDRFPAITLNAGNDSYRLEEAVTTHCTADSASFNYAKVIVRGWDPAAKQE